MKKLSYNNKLHMQTLWHCLRRTAEPVWSTRLQTFLTVLNFHPLSEYNWKRWLSHQVLAHDASVFNTQNLTRWKRWVTVEKFTSFDEILRQMYKNWQIYADMNCQQICKISRKKDSTEVQIFQTVLGALLFSKTPCIMVHHCVVLMCPLQG